MVNNTYDYAYKILLIGDSTVEKKQILRAFTEDNFDPMFIYVKEVHGREKTIEIQGNRVSLQVWNTKVKGGTTIRKSYYEKARGIMLVYDIRDYRSFASLQNWVDTTYAKAKLDGEPMEIMVIGNFCDMEEQRQVPTADGQMFAKQHGFQFYEVSHNETFNISLSFYKLAQAILEKDRLDEFRRADRLKVRPHAQPPRSTFVTGNAKLVAKIFNTVACPGCYYCSGREETDN